MTELLRIEGVCKAFGGVQALNECGFDVAQGSIAGLIGPNGSGKTTLFNVITGYERTDRGEVYLNGSKITNLPPDKVFALGIGRTFQLTRVFSRLTVMENMIVAAHHRERAGRTGRNFNPFARAGGPATRRRATELLEFTGIETPARSPRRSPTASANCWNFPMCSWPSRRSSCWTSRPAGSTPR
jgi:ABC-type branched-subunit amino acid transport system ATPase component